MKKFLMIIPLLFFIGCKQKPLIDDMVNGSANITSVTPSPLAMGKSAVIAGKNFGATQGNNALYLNDVKLTDITSWSDTSITFTVPSSGITPGILKVVTPNGQSTTSSLGLSVTVLPNNKWIETGITVKSGISFRIEASGIIKVDSCVYTYLNSQGYSFTPSGSLGTAVYNTPGVTGWMYNDLVNYNSETMTTYSLIGIIVMDNGSLSRFLVSSHYSSSSHQTGSLKLAVNTYYKPDNVLGKAPDVCSGQFTANIYFE